VFYPNITRYVCVGLVLFEIEGLLPVVIVLLMVAGKDSSCGKFPAIWPGLLGRTMERCHQFPVAVKIEMN
jgi:hypothetical protein